MGCCDVDEEWVQARITATKDLIVAYESAILALSTAGGAQSYSLDTGQTRQSVTRADLSSMRIALDGLEARLAYYQNQLSGCGSFAVKPAW
jgi:hypothetical protein